jgi:hypothetical protein
MEREHASELREHEHRRRYESNLHKLNLVKEKIQQEKETIENKLEAERQANPPPYLWQVDEYWLPPPPGPQAQVDLVIALQAEIRFAQTKYKAVREELAAAVVGWDHERKRVAEIQSYWHHNQGNAPPTK